jgi:hypothetical protein
MRKSRRELDSAFVRISDYGDEVVGRYLRRIKFTCLDPEDAAHFIDGVCRRVDKKSRYPRWDHWDCYTRVRVGTEECAIWLNGEFVRVEGDEYKQLYKRIKKLGRLISKTRSLEREMIELQEAALTQRDGSLTSKPRRAGQGRLLPTLMERSL